MYKMARDINSVILIGRLCSAPQIKYTTSGQAVAKFSIACNDSYKQGEERKEYVSYLDINVWGNQAVNCEKYLQKGSQVAINGTLRQNRWQDKQSGQTRSKIEITANSVQFLGKGKSEGGDNSPSNYDDNLPDSSDDIPF